MISCKVTTVPENVKQSRAHARNSLLLVVHLPVYRGSDDIISNEQVHKRNCIRASLLSQRIDNAEQSELQQRRRR